MAQPRRRAQAAMAAHIAAGLDTAPPERWTHGQERAPDTMTRAPHQVRNAVQALYDAGRIGDRERDAADRFRHDYVVGIEGVRETDRIPGRSEPGVLHFVMLSRIQSVTAHRIVTEVIGPGPTAWLLAFIVEDLSIAAMARRFMSGGSDARAGMAESIRLLLTILPGLYLMIDRKIGGPRVRRADLWSAAAGISSSPD